MNSRNSKKHAKAYVLAAYELVETNNGSVSMHQGDVFSIDIRTVFCGVFSDVKHAEKAVKHMVKMREDEIACGWALHKWFGFMLVEHWIDEAFDVDDIHSWPCGFRSMRTYLGDGSLNCFSGTDEACTKKFAGAKRESRFKSGDFAWILRKHKIVPALIEKEALSRDEWQKNMKRGVYGDFTDDSGIDFPLDCDGHDHTFSPLLFPLDALDLKLPESAKAIMEESREKWRKDGI